MDEPDDELLDSHPDRTHRRWPVALVVLALVAAGIVALVNGNSSSRPEARPSTTASVAPVIPNYATITPATVLPSRPPGRCPASFACTAGTTSASARAAITAAIGRVFGRPVDVEVSAQIRPGSGVLYSRTVVATVPAGTLYVALSRSDDEAQGVFVPVASGGAAYFTAGYLGGFHVSASLALRASGSAPQTGAALDRLIGDARLAAR